MLNNREATRLGRSRKKVKIALATPIGFGIFRAPFLRHQRPVIFTAILTQNADNQSVGPEGPP
jgi:hypothetical protein